MIAVFSELLLAQARAEPKYEGIRRAFSGSPNEPEFWMLVGGLFAISLAIVIVARLARRHPPEPPAREVYLKQAIDVLGLSEAERRTLLDVAERAQLDEPAAMLLTPANLEYALRRALQARPDGTLRQRVEGICKRIHEALLPEELPSEPVVEG